MNAQHLVANPSDSHDKGIKRWVWAFGAYGDVRVLVYAHPEHWDESLEHAVEWLEENAPGVFCDEQVTEAYNENAKTCEDHAVAIDAATEDMTSVGDHWLASWEITIVSEDASREELAGLLGLGDEDA